MDLESRDNIEASTAKMPPALLALALGAFAIGTTEFVTTGLLSEIAQDFNVSIPAAGLLTSGYALSVVVGAPLLTAATVGIRRKYTLIFLMLLFTIGSVISALAPNYTTLMIGRVVSAFAHGAFFGIGAVVAASVVSSKKSASAIALMFTGVTLANVFGMPMGTMLGQHFGWHFVFWVIACLGLISMLCIVTLVPNQGPVVGANLRQELAVFRDPKVCLALLVTTIGFGGLLSSFAFIAPMMTQVAGFPASDVVWLLSLYGVGLVIGNYLGGKAADRALTPTIFLSLAALAILLFVFTFTAHYKIPAAITLFLLGVIGFGTIPALQMQVMQYASKAPNLASAVNIAAFNLGVGFAVGLGGYAIHLGFGYTAANWVGGILTTIGLAIAIINYCIFHKKSGAQA